MTFSAPTPLVMDTDVASFLIKDDPVRAPRYLRHLRSHTVFLPFSVVAELLYGAEAPLLTHNARHYAGVSLLQVITEPDASP